MADTERLTSRTERMDAATECNPHADNRHGDSIFVNETVLRRMICSVVRWPAVACCVVIILVAAAVYVRVDSIGTTVTELSERIGAQDVAQMEAEQRVDAVAQMRKGDVAEVRTRLNDLGNRVEYVVSSIDKFRNSTDKLDGRLKEISERMDRAQTEVNREADARRDLIRTMEAFGQRLQRQ